MGYPIRVRGWGSLTLTLCLTVTLTLANPKAWNMELEAGFG